ncbi:MAG: response regulator [Rickettsiales bacterium]|nr:response regulator [Rickettsiales bacterium]
MPQTILVVDDNEDQGLQLANHIRTNYGFHTLIATSARDALERLMLKLQPVPDAIITQSAMMDLNGAQLIRKIRYADKQTPIIVMCAASSDKLQECIAAGASDVLIKPFTRAQLSLSIQNVLRASNLDKEVARLSRFQNNEMQLPDLVGKSAAIASMKKQAKALMHTRRPIFIQGESGTGKECLARVIHGSSELSGKPFVVFQPKKYLSDDLAMSGLQQAFFDAIGGTLLIKHIDQAGELVLESLQALQSNAKDKAPRLMATSISDRQSFLRNTSVAVDKIVHFITASSITMPALRECENDTYLLADHYLGRLSETSRYPVYSWSQDALTLMQSYEWPGNHVEMQHIIQHVLYHCDQPQVQSCHVVTAFAEHNLGVLNTLEQNDGLAPLIQEASQQSSRVNVLNGDGNVRTIDELEADMIRYAIRHYNGKMTEVAKRLGIGRSTLYRKIQDYNLDEAAA